MGDLRGAGDRFGRAGSAVTDKSGDEEVGSSATCGPDDDLSGSASSDCGLWQMRGRRNWMAAAEHRLTLRRLKSFSHDGTMSCGQAETGGGRPTTQCTRTQQRESMDSPDMLNSRQLRRRVARWSEDSEETAGEDGGGPTILQSLQNAACASWFNVLLVFVPLGYVAYYLQWPVVAVFVLNYLAIMPLSALMGFATEEVSLRLGPTWGGVVNAAFGNVVELIVAVIALMEEEYRIVQAGLIGSVLSNTLLMLGCAFVAGGLRYRVQLFRVEAAQCAGALLALSVMSMIIPAAYHSVHASGGEITNGILVMSRGTALILLVVYVLFLVFQLKTHSDLFARHDEEAGYLTDCSGLMLPCDQINTGSIPCCQSQCNLARADTIRKKTTCHLRRSAPLMHLWAAVALLLLVGVLVAMSSDILVDSVEELTTHYAISHTFVGMILLPIASGIAEHAMSVTVAMRDQMDLCITVAVGASMQMTLLVLPLLILIAWVMHRPLTLFFDDFETTTMLISVLVINYLIMNGRSNWLKGTMLLSSYFIIALAFVLYPSDVDNPRAAIPPTSSRSGVL
ncbi:hypothetical protein GGF46_004705 [Coemansia sp. RSA 552]|nr:hypothetical protein GGF46_004705 [Coemansia sp. RSA 552]